MRILSLTKKINGSNKQKLLTILILTLMASLSYAEPLNFGNMLTGVKDVVKKFSLAASLSNMLAMETSTGSIGEFPHFGLGGGQTITFTGVTNFLEASQGDGFTYSSIPGYGYASNFNLRIGGPKFGKIDFPYELGVYAGSLDSDNFISSSNTSSDLSYNILNLGFILRVPFFQEQRLMPGITLGLMYGHSNATVKFPYQLPLSLISVKTEGDTVTSMLVDSTSLEYSVYTNAVGLSVHASKLLLFFEPMMSISPIVSFVNSDARVNAKSILIHVYEEGGDDLLGKTIPYDQYEQTYGKLSDEVEINSNGISFTDGSVYGGVLFTSGFGIRIWKLYTDMLFSYEPFSGSYSIKAGWAFNY